jgi:hypothetical protein
MTVNFGSSPDSTVDRGKQILERSEPRLEVVEMCVQLDEHCGSHIIDR